ncbi:hypothetical protein T07_4 [Trichinella nelsoni]|uniref:Uncharacterized protein n=1 Tax=Trichinella nelsoni TaxID=6336 RepID=A0A0V0SDX7_9BILA|nr:hypothetical protein T07_4 [Trichinella nelsoni]
MGMKINRLICKFYLPYGYAWGYASGNFFENRNFLKFSLRRLRLCPRANKNLHIPAGYAQSILMQNLCKFLIAYGLCPWFRYFFRLHQSPYFFNSIHVL